MHCIEMPASGEGCKIVYYNKVVPWATAHEAQPSETFCETERPEIEASCILLLNRMVRLYMAEASRTAAFAETRVVFHSDKGLLCK